MYIFPGDKKYHLAFHEPMLGLYRHSHMLKYTRSLLMFGHNAGTETKMYKIITRSWISYPAMYIFNWTSNKKHVGLAERQNVGKQSWDDTTPYIAIIHEIRYIICRGVVYWTVFATIHSFFFHSAILTSCYTFNFWTGTTVQVLLVPKKGHEPIIIIIIITIKLVFHTTISAYGYKFENGVPNKAVVLAWVVTMPRLSCEKQCGNALAAWWLAGWVLSWCFIVPLGVLLVMKTLKRWMVHC